MASFRAALALTVLSAASLTSLPAAAPKLAEVLTPEEFRNAGLDKLTDEELAYLSEVLHAKSNPAEYAAAPEPPADEDAERTRTLEPPTPSEAQTLYPFRGDDAFGQEQKLREGLEKAHGAPDVLISRIEGQFRGWRGNTVFKLANGQVWQQIDGRRFVVDLEYPEVTIERGSFGSYFLTVKGYGSRTKVKRVD